MVEIRLKEYLFSITEIKEGKDFILELFKMFEPKAYEYLVKDKEKIPDNVLYKFIETIWKYFAWRYFSYKAFEKNIVSFIPGIKDNMEIWSGQWDLISIGYDAIEVDDNKDPLDAIREIALKIKN